MKLRVRHNSLRLRLGKSEIDLLSHGQECREVIHFPGGARLDYVLSASTEPEGEPEIRVCFAASTIRVAVSSAQLADWCASNRTGFSAEIPVEGTAPLHILIERDFRCLDPSIAEDQSDTFDNPLEAHSLCDA